jgi:hypothetical protein
MLSEKEKPGMKMKSKTWQGTHYSGVTDGAHVAMETQAKIKVISVSLGAPG